MRPDKVVHVFEAKNFPIRRFQSPLFGARVEFIRLPAWRFSISLLHWGKILPLRACRQGFFKASLGACFQRCCVSFGANDTERISTNLAYKMVGFDTLRVILFQCVSTNQNRFAFIRTGFSLSAWRVELNLADDAFPMIDHFPTCPIFPPPAVLAIWRRRSRRRFDAALIGSLEVSPSNRSDSGRRSPGCGLSSGLWTDLRAHSVPQGR